MGDPTTIMCTKHPDQPATHVLRDGSDACPSCVKAARQPQTWSLPPEPGPEVKAVRDQGGNRWDRDIEGGWRFADTTVPGVKGVRIVWSGLVSQFGPLSEVVDTDAP